MRLSVFKMADKQKGPDTAPVKELRNRDVPISTLDKKTRSSSAGGRTSTANALKSISLSMSSRDIAKAGSKVSFDTPTEARPLSVRRNSVSIAQGVVQEGGGTLPPLPPPPPERSETSAREAESLDGVTLHDVKSEINDDMGDGEDSDRNDYEDFDAGSEGDEEAI